MTELGWGDLNDATISERIEERARYVDWLIQEDFEPEGPALAVLIDADVVFLNTFHWKIDWPTAAQRSISLSVICDGVFAAAPPPDTEEMRFEDVIDVYKHWRKDPEWGVAFWVAKRRRCPPLKPIRQAIEAAGIWDINEVCDDTAE